MYGYMYNLLIFNYILRQVPVKSNKLATKNVKSALSLQTERFLMKESKKHT